MRSHVGSGSALKSLLGLVVSAFLLVAQTGCETPAQRLDSKAVETIKPGVTTRQEVLKEFGAPRETLTAGNRTLLIYKRFYSGVPSHYGPTTDSYLLVLSVLFNSDDRVLRKHYSSHALDTFYYGGRSVGTKIEDKTVAQIQPRVTTRKEALALLGEPTQETLTTGGHLVVDWAYDRAVGFGARNFRMLRLIFTDADVVTVLQNIDYH
jgi:outer membrane protein assembly factor BamE (lipoprotein component of BamABCDE complex)